MISSTPQMKFLLTLLASMLFASCMPTEKEFAIPSRKIVVQSSHRSTINYNFWRQDTVLNAARVSSERILQNRETHEIDFSPHSEAFLSNCSCSLTSNGLEIQLDDNGGWMYNELKLLVSDTIIATQTHSTDIVSHIIHPRYVRLELSNTRPSVSEVVHGRIITLHDTLWYQVDPPFLKNKSLVDLNVIYKSSGHFRCKIERE